MKNLSDESANDLDVTFPQYFSDNGPRLVVSGLTRTLLTHCPLTAIINIDNKIPENAPYWYIVGLAFYVPDGSTVATITFNITKKSASFLEATITYTHS